MLKVLCLHGKSQNGEIFDQRINRLQKKLKNKVEFYFIDAPFLMPQQEGQSVCMRKWYSTPSKREAPWTKQDEERK
eukprot:Pgem_evm1s17202